MCWWCGRWNVQCDTDLASFTFPNLYSPHGISVPFDTFDIPCHLPSCGSRCCPLCIRDPKGSVFCLRRNVVPVAQRPACCLIVFRLLGGVGLRISGCRICVLRQGGSSGWRGRTIHGGWLDVSRRCRFARSRLICTFLAIPNILLASLFGHVSRTVRFVCMPRCPSVYSPIYGIVVQGFRCY